MTTRNKCFDAIDALMAAGENHEEWTNTKLGLIREYIHSLEAYIKEIEQDYDELYQANIRGGY